MSTGTLDRTRPPRPRSTPLIDPRLRERRNEVSRAQGRRRLRRLVVAVVVVLVGVGAGLAVRSPLLDVDRVVLRGGAHTGADELRRATGIPLGRSMVSVDPAAARRRLLALPWVADASVERRWPGTVVVRVEERQPVAVAGSGAAAVVVDATGRALDLARDVRSVQVDDLPSVPGPPVAPGSRLGPKRVALLRTLASLPAELERQVERARATESGTTLVLDDGIVVAWGDRSRSLAKANAVLALLEQADRATIARIDVSVPTAAAVTREAGDDG